MGGLPQLDAQASTESPASPQEVQSPVELAVETAVAEERNVEILSMRDEYNQTFATPDPGTLYTETFTAAKFGWDIDGELVPVDTDLIVDAGVVRPKATAVEMRLPDANHDDVKLVYRGRELSLELPGELGAPTLVGPTATYEDIYPDVDLKLTATGEGLRQVYVVKTSEAANNPELTELSFPVETANGELQSRAGGGLSFIDVNGETVFASAPPIMWDSSANEPTTTDSADSADPAARSDRSRSMQTGTDLAEQADGDGDAPKPAVGDEVAEMEVSLEGDVLQVTPDQELLTGPASQFPIFIDPYLPIDRAERLMVASNDTKDWQFDGDQGMGRCPTDYDSNSNPACSGPYKKRLQYEFGRSPQVGICGTGLDCALNSGHSVRKAELAFKLDYSSSCASKGMRVRQAGLIDATTRWPGSAPGRILAERKVAGGGRPGTNCAGKPEVAFSNATINDAVQDLADNVIPRLTVLLLAVDESDQLAWKRFRETAVLRVWFARKPATPTNLMIETLIGNQCIFSGNPGVVDTRRPTFVTNVRSVAADGGGGNLAAEFHLQVHDNTNALGWVDLGGILRTDGWVSDRTLVALTLPASRALNFGARFTYRLRARTVSMFDMAATGRGELVSGWTPLCQFKVDADPPVAPNIEAVSTYVLEPEGSAPSTPAWRGGVGVPGRFRFVPPTIGTGPGQDDDPNLDRSSYVAQVSGAGGATVAGWEAGPGIDLTPRGYGEHKISVNARDIFHRLSGTRTRSFFVRAPSESEATWHVTRDDATTVANSSQPNPDNPGEAPIGPLRLSSASLISAEGTGRRGNLVDANTMPVDTALRFPGTVAAQAKTDTSIELDGSFTLSAWAFLDQADQDRAVLSAATADGLKVLDLRYVKAAHGGVGGWSAGLSYPSGAGTVRAAATTGLPATRNVWTHLAVSYDAGTSQLTLFVNGAAAAQTILAGPSAMPELNGPLIVGRGGTETSGALAFSGLVDEVRVWRRAAIDTLVLADATVGPDSQNPYLSLVGSWAVGSSTETLEDQSAFKRPSLAKVGSGVVIDTSNRRVVLTGSGGLRTQGPVVDETAGFTVATEFSLDSAALASSNGPHRIIGQNGDGPQGSPSWALWFDDAVMFEGVLYGRLKFGRWERPGGGPSAVVEALSTGDYFKFDQNMQFNAVYKPSSEELPTASDMRVCLYAGAVEVGCAPYSNAAQGLGSLTVGAAENGGQLSEWLPGSVTRMRVWAGSATSNQLNQLNSWQAPLSGGMN